ncbi:MAG: uncharacterized protein A8A55_3577, partial [Amphiamblys sp. WSBS2006]
VMEELILHAGNIENVAEILKTENKNILVWIGKMKRLDLRGFAIEILPKLGIHEENAVEELLLYAGEAEYITEILKAENNSIWMGKIKRLELSEYAVEALPKLRIHEENEMEELVLSAYYCVYIIEIRGMENSSIWVGKIKKLELDRCAIE